TTVQSHFRLKGDSLWVTTVAPWSKDSSKTVRTTNKWVRTRRQASAIVTAANGVWRQADVKVVRPDSTFSRPPNPGFSALYNGDFYTLTLAAGTPGSQQVHRAATPEEKAARMDALSATAGTFDLRDSTCTARYDHSKNPNQVGQSASWFFKRVA